DDLVTGVQTCALPISFSALNVPSVRIRSSPTSWFWIGRPLAPGPAVARSQSDPPALPAGVRKVLASLAAGEIPGVAVESRRSAEIGRAACRERGEGGG